MRCRLAPIIAVRHSRAALFVVFLLGGLLPSSVSIVRAQVGSAAGGAFNDINNNTGVVTIPLNGGMPVASSSAPYPPASSLDVPASNLLITAVAADTWTDLNPKDAVAGVSPAEATRGTTVILLHGPLGIQLDRNVMTADSAVLWLTQVKGKILDQTRADIALVGNVTLKQPDATQTGGELFVSVQVRGVVRLTAGTRTPRNQSTTELYQQAAALRPAPPAAATTEPGEEWVTTKADTRPASTQPTTKPLLVTFPLAFSSKTLDSLKTPDGHVALVLTGDVKMFQRRLAGEFIELQAQRVVLYTNLTDLREAQKSEEFQRLEQAVQAAYLEGDVRIVHTPPAQQTVSLTASGDARRVRANRPEQRITANTVYYDFGTDRAILTQVVVHSADPKTSAPVVIRARLMRQLALGEYKAQGVQLTQSSFHTPSYSIGLDKAYIRQVDTGDIRYGALTYYNGTNVTLNALGVPVFYLPYAADEVTEHGAVFRGITTESSSRFGFSAGGEFGLFETLGIIPPKESDATYDLNYFGNRGPSFAAQGKYAAGFVTESTKEPWSFQGQFKGFFVEDHGKDTLGRGRLEVTPPTEERGRFWLQHNQYLPDDWQLQLTLGYTSDRTFLPEWFEGEFNQSQSHDTSIYAKRQRDTEALTLLVSAQLNNFITSADLYQERFEVQRFPEIGYRRIGESILDDNLTFVSQNTFAGLQYKIDRAPLADYGFTVQNGPGYPSLGYTGLTEDTTWRGDSRQELSYPVTAGRFRVVPYVMGRYTFYSQSPTRNGDVQNRVIAGAGLRILTDFWRVDDTFESRLFDIHRLRHVIEPSMQVFTSVSTVDQKNLYVYDESVDALNDVTGVQFALNQRWQTKRGDANRWRSVDVFSFNVEANLFTHKPQQDNLIINSPLVAGQGIVTGANSGGGVRSSGVVKGDPRKFRGLFFDSEPEASISRNGVNADFTWRISDSTALVSDAQYNLDYSKIATAAIGIAVQRGDRLGYFLGTRYLAELNSNVITFATDYALTPKYTLAFRQSYETGQSIAEDTSLSLIRHFDRLFVAVGVSYDAIAKQSGIVFSILPEGLGGKNNFSSSRSGTIFGQ